MKSYALSALILGLFASSVPAQDQPDLTNHNQKINYAFGLDIVSTFQQQEFDLDMKAFVAGMEDSLAGKPALTPEQKKTALEELQQYLQAKEETRRKVTAAQNLKDGQAFLAANAKKEGVQVKEIIAPDGSRAQLQYKVLKSGPDGPSPKITDIVEVHYTISLIGGTVLDSSVQRGIPATFGLKEVIPGWTAALQMMKAGDKWQLFIPANLAYAEFGPPQIPPNSTLIFEVELLSFYTPKEAGFASTNSPSATAK
jgi:FKBP-type peptidyl-prolyl cis-trans isomerase FklB